MPDPTEYDYYSPYPNEGPDHSPDCTQCADARPELEKIRDFALAQRERFADQDLLESWRWYGNARGTRCADAPGAWGRPTSC
ncbi:hypothetical protein ABTY00_34390 [Streptomyces microflavus]|uniref:hypothetical protein n=1 Tax=Streptomyces microflavus TaxID=1919 RepID=UPI00331FD786